jgi:catechol-2,3-dioxygenase
MDDTERRGATAARATIQRMDHICIVVGDLAAAMAFFIELGLELEARPRSRAARWTRSTGWRESGRTSR